VEVGYVRRSEIAIAQARMIGADDPFLDGREVEVLPLQRVTPYLTSEVKGLGYSPSVMNSQSVTWSRSKGSGPLSRWNI
jgi:hypothetical protein